MSNILDHIQTCQYLREVDANNTIANAAGEIQQVKSVDSTRVDVDVTPVIENERRVYTPVSLIEGDTGQQGIALNESSPVVEVSQEAGLGALATIYGALETVNTGTQRCGVRTSGTVLFRKTSNQGPTAGHAFDVGNTIVGPRPHNNPTLAGDNDGSVQVNPVNLVSDVDFGGTSLSFLESRGGIGTILGFVGNYLLVQLDS